MKKITIAAFIALTGSMFAQVAPTVATPQTPGTVEQSASGYKAAGSDWTFEMNFSPFSGAPLSLNYLRARLFLSDEMALRTGFTLGIRSSDPNKTFEWGLLPGIEKHFGGTERLSPYIGADVVLGGKASSSSATSNSVTTTTKGSWADGSNRGYFNLGLNVLVGCDFYFSKRIYTGIEAGFGLSLISFSDLTQSVIPNGGTTVTTTTPGGSTFQLGPNFNSAIRLGFVF